MTTHLSENDVCMRTQMGCLEIEGNAYPLYEGINLVGRNRSAVILLKDENVSHFHAIVTIVDKNRHFVTDMQSVNGTTCGNNKLQPYLLHEVSQDEVICFANIKAVYKKVLNNTQPADENSRNNNDTNQQMSDIVSQSFYMAQTQHMNNINQIQNNSNADIPACFDDEYNFSDMPSPPVCEISNTCIKEDSTVIKNKQTIHELPTQIIPIKKNENANLRNETLISIHDLPTQILTDVNDETDPLVDANNSCLDQSPKLIEKNGACPDEKPLSNIDCCDKSVDDGKNISTIAITCHSDSNSESQLHVSQLQLKKRKTILDDSEKDTGDKLKKAIVLTESPRGNSENENICKVEQKIMNVINSDSETDAEDNQDCDQTKLTETSEKILVAPGDNDKTNNSGSETELDESDDLVECSVECEDQLKMMLENDETKKELSVHFKMDDKEKVPLNVIDKSVAVDMVPQTSDTDDDDDFNFMPKDNSSIIDKAMTESVDKLIINTTQNFEETHSDSFHLTFSEFSENSENVIKTIQKENVSTDALNASDISVDTKDSVHEQPTQKVDVISKDTSKIDDSDKIIQKVTAENHNDCENDKVNKREKIILENPQESVAVADSVNDDIFLHPTQKFDNEINSGDEIFKRPAHINFKVNKAATLESDADMIDEDIFLKSTQKIMQEDEVGDIHRPNDESSIKNSEVIKSDDTLIFIQPDLPTDIRSKEKSEQEHKSIIKTLDISDEPIQTIEIIKPTKDNAVHDILDQPTQELASNIDTNSKKTKLNNKLCLSTRKDLEPKSKVDEVESQLEVMFETQTLKLNTQIDTRPLNPLVNVLNEQKDSEECRLDINSPYKENDTTNSPRSCHSSDSLKEYCNNATLPMDEFSEENTDKDSLTKPSKSTTEKKEDNETSAESMPRKQKCLPKTNNGVENSASAKVSSKQLDENNKKIDDVVSENDEMKNTEHINKSVSKKEKKETPIEQQLKRSTRIRTKRKMSFGEESKDVKEKESTEKRNTKQTKPRVTSENKEKSVKKDSTYLTDSDGSEDAENDVNARESKKRRKVESKDAKEKDPTEKSNTKQTKPRVTSEGKGKSVKKDSTSLTDSDGSEDVENDVNARESKKRRKVESKDAKEKDPTEKSNTKQTKPRVTSEGKGKSVKKDSTSLTDSSGSEDAENDVNAQKSKNRRKSLKKSNKGVGSSSKENDKQEVPEQRETKRVHAKNLNLKRNSIPPGSIESNSNKKETDVSTRTVRRTRTQNKNEFNETSDVDVVVTSNVSVISVSSDSSKNITPEKNAKHKTGRETELEENTDGDNKVNKREVNTRSRVKNKNADVPESTATSSRKTSKRVLNLNNEKGRVKASAKRVKNDESLECERLKSDSEVSDTIQTPSKNRKQHTTNLDSTISTPERNRRILKPKIVFTMLNNPKLELLARNLGGMLVDTVKESTVLVTGCLKRSQKLLSAVGQGKPICSPNWLYECKKANKFLDPWTYILEDQEAESRWNFSLKESLKRSQSKKLLEEFTFLLLVTEAVDVLKEAIDSCGGKWVLKKPAKSVTNNFVVVANPNKKAAYSKFLQQNPPPMVVAAEAIFDGVLRQELNWDKHLLT